MSHPQYLSSHAFPTLSFFYLAQSLCLLLVIKSGHCSLSGASLQIIMPNVKLQLVLIAIVIGLVTAKQSKDENNDSFGCEHQTVRSQKATIPFCGQPLFEDPKEPHRATSFIFRPAKSDDHSPNHFKCLGPEPLRKYCCLPNRIKDNPKHYQSSKAVGGHCVRITKYSEKESVVDLPR
ncbi:hypothetical protein KEM48_010395 [Puccinia striiformis f. sp. tritici PST-130]|nr:hypothetical protein Pst134EB_027427 [Puccinia striiformis f. sp. tritici]KAI9626566.1 hypothetical protein KEM48_010395 [Puccinia striiformis f. sp. tritici PST-130]